MIEIDGSIGEGGGQVIRSALSLSALLSKPFHIINIRGNRPKPGLRAQHLAAVRAMKEISGAMVEGDKIDSRELRFQPGPVRSGEYAFDIGTAGATPLVLQTLLPPLIFADRVSRLALIGGTHVPISPPFHFLSEVFLPFLNEMGIHVRASLRSYGFYPKGGGRIEVEIRPTDGQNLAAPISQNEKAPRTVHGISAVANLPRSIAERQKDAVLQELKRENIGADIEIKSVRSPGTGTFVFLLAAGLHCRAGFSSIGVRGKPAETVGSEAALSLIRYYTREGCLDPHLVDQIVLYLALLKGESSFTTTEVTNHLLTNLHIIELFLDNEYRVEGAVGSPGRVMIQGIG
jgi:RNA 3'-terminal phosphate cyclase (ATP)